MAHRLVNRWQSDRSKSDSASAPDRSRRRPGIRIYALLVIATAAVTVIVTSLSLLVIRYRLRAQVTDDLALDLDRSVMTFRNLQAERLQALDRENALLAELPTLKALLTSGDERTIQDGALEFWQISSTDLFALANSSGHIVAVYTRTASTSNSLRPGLQALLASPARHYLIDGGSLYSCSVRPLYFGSAESGTLLGYVVSGVSIERTVREVSQPTGVEATFLSGGQIVASTLDPSMRTSLAAQSLALAGSPRVPSTVTLGNARFLAATEDLTAASIAPLQLVVLKSFEPAERTINRIDRMVLSAGLLALLSGAILMAILSRFVTRPLEELSKSVRAFGMGDSEFRVPRYGTREVRQLTKAFSAMRNRIQEANRALLESERLATIGSMASSVSHDLRHYLAAIYANSEFLASDRLSPKERTEIFADIRSAVLGTTDMIESLLIFSRTGSDKKRSHELMATLLERSVALIHAHPDAEHVTLRTHYDDPVETAVHVDGKQIERAIFNLLLNACQAVRSSGDLPLVTATLETRDEFVILNVLDNGDGVPEKIRTRLFEPFVSEGKQKGTGLGLTLVHRIAVEHGGAVALLSSRPGETIFQLKLPRASALTGPVKASEAEFHDRVIEHENARMRK